MNAASLPYTVLMLLVELAVGSLAVVTLFDGRGMVTRGYVQLGSLLVLPLALLALWSTGALGSDEVIGGYALQLSWKPRLTVALYALIALSALHLVAAFGASRRATVVFGTRGSMAGIVVLATLAALVALPTWSYAGMFASMLAAALVLGGALMAMSWGHWYLTNSGLPKEPLEQMSLLVLGALIVQTLLVVVAAAAPVREVPLTQAAFGVSLGENPAFWFRVGVGLIFPIVLAWLAWQAATIRGMMSATGLLYIAVGAVLAGEVLARGLLFATGAAV